jgi:UDP-N-acetylmuramoyl-tripeptide--D-alanyl-D-alanine ligase
MPAGGTVFVNGDDDLLYGYECPRKKLCFGTGEHNDVRAESIISDDSGTRCDIVAGSRRITAVIPAYGQHMVYAALAGASVGMKLGLTDEEIAAGIASYKTVGRRASVLDTGFVTLIDDCYNANPDSMKCALDSMAKLSGRKVCILGDMLELGGNSPALHRAVGEYAAENGAELILTVGSMAENISAGAAQKGARSEHFSTVEELISALPGCLRAGDTVLVKASHSMKFENISEAIKTIK